jgi:hypothetical protein
MRVWSVLAAACAAAALASGGYAASTGSPFYGDPPDEHHPWAIHDQNRPQPKVVTPGTFSTPEQPGKPPSDAIVLFDGTDLSKWEADTKEGGPTKWIVRGGAMECTPGSGYIRTKDKFGDCQLHVEWAAPRNVQGESQGRGNSGIFLMGLVEIQVLDDYNNPTYADGFAGSVYGVNPPAANPLHPPGEFQVCDIVFRRPVYKDGRAVDPGYVTVFLNGVLVQDHTMLEGSTGHMRRTKPGPFPEKGPLKLQDHGNPVRFRNIWYRPLGLRAVEGGTDGFLSAEAAMAKRKELAAAIRQDAAKLRSPDNPLPELLRLMESLVYENDEATAEKVGRMAGQYVDGVKKLPPDGLAPRKDDVKRLGGALQYLVRFNILPAAFAPKAEVDKLIKDQGWDKR